MKRSTNGTKATIAKPVRLAIIMSDGTIEPVEISGLATLNVDDRSDRITLCDALRVALVRVKAVAS